MSKEDSPAARPFLKWTGSKRQLVEPIATLLGNDWEAYCEPFLGGGSVFFHLSKTRAPFIASLHDTNARLVRAFRGVRDNVERVITLLGTMPYDRDFFEKTRAVNPDAYADDSSVAAWFVYLNKSGFNGLYRVNRSGKFNVPFGRYTNPTICDAENLRACSIVLRRASVEVLDFETALGGVGSACAVYCDPPYVPLSKTSDFTGYTADGFREEDQVRLRDAARRAGQRGARVVLSNSDCPLVRSLYTSALGFRIHEVEVRRSTSSKVTSRGAHRELLIEFVR